MFPEWETGTSPGATTFFLVVVSNSANTLYNINIVGFYSNNAVDDNGLD